MTIGTTNRDSSGSANYTSHGFQILVVPLTCNLMEKLPGMGDVPDAVKNQVNDKDIRRQVAIINSMTPNERQYPAVIKGSRRRRIAMGSGTQVQDVNRLLKQFMQMQKMMKRMRKGGMAKMMRGLKGRMPPGMPF